MLSLFPTTIYYASLGKKSLDRELVKEVYQIKDYDIEGQKWSKDNYKGGYTSYASLAELFQMSSTFLELKKQIDKHVIKYTKSLDFVDPRLQMTNLWINIVPRYTYHSFHLHPGSVISGTYYLKVPPKSGDIKFEDPRVQCFMGSVPRKENAKLQNRRYHSIEPKAGKILLFESWLKHEVTQNWAKQDRISLSFNYS